MNIVEKPSYTELHASDGKILVSETFSDGGTVIVLGAEDSIDNYSEVDPPIIPPEIEDAPLDELKDSMIYRSRQEMKQKMNDVLDLIIHEYAAKLAEEQRKIEEEIRVAQTEEELNNIRERP